MATKTDELARVPLFSTLSDRQRKKLAKLFRERSVPAGTALVKEGTMSGAGFFVVADGEAVVSVDGSEVARLHSGDHFGELALITESERTATVTAETAMRCLEIPFWDFRTFAHDNPDVMWKLLQQVVERLSAPSADA
jgi:CPA1 family monovalent cation:H+ antiporter